MDTPRVHPHDRDDDTVEAHYACLERPCACLEGCVFVGHIDDYGEEREASFRCRRCNVRGPGANQQGTDRGGS